MYHRRALEGRTLLSTLFKLRDLLLLLRCRRTVRGGVFLCHPLLGAAQRHLRRALRPTNQQLPHLRISFC